MEGGWLGMVLDDPPAQNGPSKAVELNYTFFLSLAIHSATSTFDKMAPATQAVQTFGKKKVCSHRTLVPLAMSGTECLNPCD